jgi:hypothetical protein
VSFFGLSKQIILALKTQIKFIKKVESACATSQLDSLNEQPKGADLEHFVWDQEPRRVRAARPQASRVRFPLESDPS